VIGGGERFWRAAWKNGTLGLAVFAAESAGCDQDGREDARRERTLQAAGYRVLRVTAEEVQQSLPGVVACIRAAVAEP